VLFEGSSLALPTIATTIASLAAAELERQLSVTTNGHARARDTSWAPARAARPTRTPRVSRPRQRGEEITKWVADNRARRVPRFVIEMTGGLDTKKRIVAKYGASATFEKGKPLPKPS
jgi:hypothetical protein